MSIPQWDGIALFPQNADFRLKPDSGRGPAPAENRMSAQGRALALIILAGVIPAAGHAQNLDEGKTPPQLFAAGCAACHQSPRGLGRQLGAASLATFLRQHYTTSREQAAVLAAYVASFVQQSPAGVPRPPAAVPRQGGEEPASRRRTPNEEFRSPTGQPAAPVTRRRVPGEDGRAEQQTNVPATSRQPREARQPARSRQPAAAAVQTEHAPRPDPGAAEPQQGNGPTAAIPGPSEPSTARTDDIAD
jgi:mono/diheme cytochrome c family protein